MPAVRAGANRPAQLLARLMFLVALVGRRRESIAVVASPEAPVDAVATLPPPARRDALRAALWSAVPPGRPG